MAKGKTLDKSILNMSEDIFTDLVIETLEVLTNHILYIREMYPPEIFRKRRIYNCPVSVSIYPPLNTYISEVLFTARQLKTIHQLNKVEIIIYRDDIFIYEKYVFDISNDCPVGVRNDEDEYLLKFEQQLRTSLYTLTERAKSLQKLDKDAKFKMQLHTSQAEYVKSCCTKNKDFLWLQVPTGTKSNISKEVTLLPLSIVNLSGIQISAKI